jgi:phosphatidylethanolamine/phosphatidyl-N-methylethanolamine N-methyltransferase
MENQHNQSIYRMYAPIYDIAMRRFSDVARRRAIDLLQLQPNGEVLVPGVGTGLDLPALPPQVFTIATDLSPAMLHQAYGKAVGRNIAFAVMDAQTLGFPDAHFDAVLLNLILSVVPDGAAAFREAWRVLRPSGLVAIFDKFLPEGQAISPVRRAIGAIVRWLGTDPNRRLSEVLGPECMSFIERDEPSLLNGQYQIVLLRKPMSVEPQLLGAVTPEHE